MLIRLPFLVDKYSLNISGVVHVGAHHGQEYESYIQYVSPDRIVFIEPCSPAFAVLHHRLHATGAKLIKCACGATEGTVDMFTEMKNSGQSNSILKPKGHLKQHPEIKFTGLETVSVLPLDEVINLKSADFSYNFLNIDVQGYELEVLKGAERTLQDVQYIYTEVNRGEVYENCARIQEIDAFLDLRGFERAFTAPWVGDWTDAFYLRTNY